MTTTPIPTMTLYDELGALYDEQLTHQGILASMLTHKWQRADLLSPHSDLDIRILLDRPPADWLTWNEHLAAAHTAAVTCEPLNRRLLEHPPGFAFTTAEAQHGRVSPPELATWTLIRGHGPTFQRWKSHAQMVPWSGLDERFYRALLDARLGGRYDLDADSTDNVHQDVPGYRRHCVAWHYFAPCWFAAAALATRTRCPGKSAALTQWHPPGLEPYAETFLHLASDAATNTTRGFPTAASLLRTAHVALATAMRHVPDPTTAPAVDEPDDAHTVAWTMTAGMLRVRVARWLYYLNPPPGTATDYLITREAKELHAAATVLRSLAGDESTPERQLAARMAALLPTGSTTAAVLRDTLATWHRHHTLIEGFLTLHST